MRKILSLFVVWSFILLLLWGCSGGSGGKVDMAFEKVSYVKSFPKELQLKGEPVGEIEVPGVSRFLIHDSLLVVQTMDAKGVWTVLSLEGYRKLGSFLRIGNGPNEVEAPFGPSLNESEWEDRSGETYVRFRTRRRLGCIIEVSLSEALRTGNPEFRVVNDSIPHTMFSAVMLGGAKYLGREVDMDRMRQDRFLMDQAGKKTVPPHLEKLNEVGEIPPGMDNINILSAGLRYNPEHDRVVEAPVFLNTLNIYSPDGSFTRSVCCGERAVRIGTVAEMPSKDRRRYFATQRQYGRSFGVLWHDAPLYGTHADVAASIMFFDWDGKPLCRLDLDRYADSFDIDFRTGTLYSFNSEDETFCRYDISGIAPELK